MEQEITVRHFRKDGTEIHDLSKEVVPQEIVEYINKLFRQQKELERLDKVMRA